MKIKSKALVYWVAPLFFLIFQGSLAQEVETFTDTTNIRIGEQIQYRISVKSDSTDLVTFPEGQTFLPFEMVKSYQADTSSAEKGFKITKKYALTKWDSGSYTIPRQRVIINEATFFTDSVPVEVNTVVVDTTKQKMFPIKPAVKTPEGFSLPEYFWWVIAILVLVGLSFFFFRKRRKKAEEKRSLPPFEQAMHDLHRLDDSHLLEEREVKEYYSQLSAAVRRFLDGEVYDHALESTTGELIAYLKNERDTGRLALSESTIDRLRIILDRADLAKFANSRPDVLTAKEDRSDVEHIIQDTKSAIPQPSEEDLIKDQEYQAKLARKRKLRRALLIILGTVILVSGVTAYIVTTQGFDYFRDTYLGNRSKEMLENDWIRSEYGNPPVTITTPEVLIRKLSDSTFSKEGEEVFEAGSLNRNLYIRLLTKPIDQDFNPDEAVETVFAELEERGGRNILTKQEEVSTINGAEGMRLYGAFGIPYRDTDKVLEKKYEVLNFAEGIGYQQILIIYNAGDSYAEEISERIKNSVELRNAGN